MPGTTGPALHAAAWTAAALLWAAAVTRALGEPDGPGGNRPGLARRATLCLGTLLAVAAGARLHARLPGILGGAWAPSAVRHLLAPATGWRIGGGLLGGLAFLALLGPRWLGDRSGRGMILDRAAPPCGVAIAVGRLGCIAAGCCFGRPCELPWCTAHAARSAAWWSQVAVGLLDERAPMSLPVHPVPHYLAAAALLAAWVAVHGPVRSLGAGSAALAFAAVLAASRLAIEPLRETAFGQGPSIQGPIDMAALAVASVGLAARAARHRAGDETRARTRRLPPSSPGMPND